MPRKKKEEEAPTPASKVVPLIKDETYIKPDSAVLYGYMPCFVAGCTARAEVYDYGKGKYVVVHQTKDFPRTLHEGAFGADVLDKVTKL